MASKGRGFNKRRRRRQERRRVLVVTEGIQTEIQYLQGLIQFLRSAGASVQSTKTKGVGKDPARVVKAAVDMDQRDVDGYDEVWVVLDVDKHANLDQALRDGKESGLSIVVSNPCFEIWLVWHYQDCDAHQEPQQAADKLSRFDHFDKKIPNSFPYEAHEEAMRRAGDRVAPGETGPNPSSAMPHLVYALQRGS